MISAIHLHNCNTGHDEGILYSFPAGAPPRFILSSNAIYDYPTPARVLFDVSQGTSTSMSTPPLTRKERHARS